jgi:hypothetical protein
MKGGITGEKRVIYRGWWENLKERTTWKTQPYVGR